MYIHGLSVKGYKLQILLLYIVADISISNWNKTTKKLHQELSSLERGSDIQKSDYVTN